MKAEGAALEPTSGTGRAAAAAILGPAIALVLALGGPLLLAGADGPVGPWLKPLEGVSWTALALLPWLALAGWPRAAGPAPGWGAALVPWAASVPAFVLCARLDQAAGAPSASLALLLGHGLGLGFLLAAGAEAARRRGAAAARRHGRVWLLLMAAAPLLAVALDWAGRPGAGEPPAWVSGTASLSPLVWCSELAREGRLIAGAEVTAPVWPWLAVVLVLVAAWAPARAAGEPSP